MINDWGQIHKEQMMKVVAHNRELQKEIDRLKNNEDKLGTLEESIEFDKKRNYQYTSPTIVKNEQGKVVAVTLTNEEHQVQEVLWQAPRDLSDEEIHDIWKKQWESGNIGHIAYNFAKAILKKASEK